MPERLWIPVMVRLAGLVVLLAVIVLLCQWLPLPATAQADAFFLADCGGGCPLGIQPGITSLSEARSLLSSHPWVADVKDEYASLRWTWNGTQPASILGDGGWALLRIDTVYSVSMAGAAYFGNVETVLGAPQVSLRYPNPVRNAVRYDLLYRHSLGQGSSITLFARLDIPCPLRRSSLLRTPVDLTWYASPIHVFVQESAALPYQDDLWAICES